MTAGPSCYTSARIDGGRLRHESAHLARLARDAALLSLGRVDIEGARRAMHEAGHAFGDGSGIVRIELSRARDGIVQVTTTRPLGPTRESWRAITASETHPGADAFAGVKRSGVPLYQRARDEATRADADEAILVDASGVVVEGARSNLIIVSGDGTLRTPPLARGAVAGVALAILRAVVPDLREADVLREDLRDVRELIAVNAVRGAVPIVLLDGIAVGDGRPGPLSAHFARLLDAAA